MQKEFEYKGYKFITSVAFNTYVERHPGGIVKHTVTTNCTGGNNFYVKKDVIENDIILETTLQESAACEYVDKLEGSKIQSPLEQKLSTLGFK